MCVTAPPPHTHNHHYGCHDIETKAKQVARAAKDLDRELEPHSGMDYEVDEILDEQAGVVKVKWAGFALADATWERLEDCGGCRALLAKFRAKKLAKPTQTGRARALLGKPRARARKVPKNLAKTMLRLETKQELVFKQDAEQVWRLETEQVFDLAHADFGVAQTVFGVAQDKRAHAMLGVLFALLSEESATHP